MVLFDVIRHQETAVRALREAWERGKMPHALLFWGPGGVGKLRTAHALAQMLLCSSQSPPCGACSICDRVIRFTHPDLLLIAPAIKSALDGQFHKALAAYGQDLFCCLETPPKASIWIERIRELKAESSKARVERGNRVAIIRDAERMTLEAAQAALKLIEEPTAGTYLVLTCRDPEQLLPTILSRCRKLRFRQLPREFIEQVLRERSESAGAHPRVVATLAQGSLGQALSWLDEDVLELRDRALELFQTDRADPAAVGREVRSLGRTWDLDKAQASVDLLMMWFEDLLLLHHGLPEDAVTNTDRLQDLRRLARGISVAEIKRRSGVLEEMLQSIRQNVNPVLATETALLRLNRLVEESGLF